MLVYLIESHQYYFFIIKYIASHLSVINSNKFVKTNHYFFI